MMKNNCILLEEQLIQSKFIDKDSDCTLEDVKQMLYDLFDSIEYEATKEDVRPFIRDFLLLNLWSADFFKQITDEIKKPLCKLPCT